MGQAFGVFLARRHVNALLEPCYDAMEKKALLSEEAPALRRSVEELQRQLSAERAKGAKSSTAQLALLLQSLHTAQRKLRNAETLIGQCDIVFSAQIQKVKTAGLYDLFRDTHAMLRRAMPNGLDDIDDLDEHDEETRALGDELVDGNVRFDALQHTDEDGALVELRRMLKLGDRAKKAEVLEALKKYQETGVVEEKKQEIEKEEDGARGAAAAAVLRAVVPPSKLPGEKKEKVEKKKVVVKT